MTISMVDFTVIPPEVTSGLIYAGPGPGLLLAAATAWEGLAAELSSSVVSYQSAISGMTDTAWCGPSAAAMQAAISPFVSWMAMTAALARQTGAQAQAAAGAYETALAAVVPPAVIAANRARLGVLLANNMLGQNNAEIAATEAAYGEFWSEDAAAMYSYASSAAAASRLEAFTEPPAVTTGASAAGPGAATAQAVGTGAIPQLLQALATRGVGLANPSAGTGTGSTLLQSAISNYLSLFSSAGSLQKGEGIYNASAAAVNLGMAEFKTFFHPLFSLPDIPKAPLAAGLGGSGSWAVGAGLTGAASSTSESLGRVVAATAGEAPSIGALSVPTGWATATPAIRLAATALPAGSGAMTGSTGLFAPAMLGGLTGSALGAPGARLMNSAGIRAGTTPTARGGTQVQLDRVIAQLQNKKDAVQHWRVDEAGLDDLLTELSAKPGFHAVHLSKRPKNQPPISEPTSG